MSMLYGGGKRFGNVDYMLNQFWDKFFGGGLLGVGGGGNHLDCTNSNLKVKTERQAGKGKLAGQEDVWKGIL